MTWTANLQGIAPDASGNLVATVIFTNADGSKSHTLAWAGNNLTDASIKLWIAGVINTFNTRDACQAALTLASGPVDVSGVSLTDPVGAAQMAFAAYVAQINTSLMLANAVTAGIIANTDQVTKTAASQLAASNSAYTAALAAVSGS